MSTPYEILGVMPDADDEAIKKAFRHKARKTHPDSNSSPDAAERFDGIQKAYLVLSDKKKRAHFDKTGEIPVDEKPADAIGILVEIFNGAIGVMIQGKQFSLGVYMRENLNANIERVKSNIPDLNVKVKKLEALKGKIKYRGPGTDFLEMHLDALLEEAMRAKGVIEQRLSDLEAAKELLAYFTFPEPPPVVSSFQGASFHFTGDPGRML